MKQKKEWYKSTWFTILMLLFVFPVGLFLMWKFKSWRLWVKILITVLVVMGAVNMMTNNNVPQNDNTSNTNSESKSEKKQDTKKETKAPHKMNEVVKLDKLEFNVTNKAVADQVGNVLTNKAKGTFIVLDVTVKNNGDKAVDIANSFFKLVGDGKTYEADSAASTTANQAVSPDDLGFFGDKINPDSTKNGKVVFDVSKEVANKQNLVLQVQSGVFGTKTEKIKLK
ncbi:DUF4352 domain-containing protein [Staphylococcus simulans]|uniref:DUF4352 domain-containing protein n=1 Tax=Staphylococcus simulans TaxID=1286 RepID=UPI001F1A18C3|nr:DUF4352 domain-containing protein [Staphylococcus simulans]